MAESVVQYRYKVRDQGGAALPTGRDTVTLPIIALPQVLFPGVQSVFEITDDSVRRLVKESVEQDSAIAVVLERPAAEAGNFKEPYSIGTSARPIQLYPSETGPTRVSMVGVTRISLLSYRQNGQILVGQFRFLLDSEDPVPVPLADEARALGSELWSLLAPRQSHPILPSTAQMLSYWVAAHIPLSVAAQQELLEIRSTRARLAKEISIMRTILDGSRAEQSG